MRKEPMVLQPQAGFGTAQEEVDRIYDYMQPMITCNDNHYVGTKGNNGAYQDGAYAVCLEVRLQFPYLNFHKIFTLYQDVFSNHFIFRKDCGQKREIHVWHIHSESIMNGPSMKGWKLLAVKVIKFWFQS